MAALTKHTRGTIVRRLAAWVCMLALVSSALANATGSSEQQASAARLNENQRILHVLNRLGFGPRPGDVERVKSIGLDRYIDQQLHPERISDAAVEARLQDLATLRMSTAELIAKYPNPGMLLRQLQRRGEVPADLAALRENRTKGKAVSGAAAPPTDSGAQMEAPAGNSAPGSNGNAQAKAGDNAEYRQALREYYLKNNLQLPRVIIQDLQASRILRAVYSERQLQEVMVDFWTNHFNIFAGKGMDQWFLTSYDRDVIRPHAFGKFQDLLLATAQSPAMLFYLDNFQSVSPHAQMGGQNRRRELLDPFGRMPGRINNNPFRRNGANLLAINRELLRAQQQGTRIMREGPQTMPQPQRPRRGINENYARELMELHTLGVDGGYTQKDVQEVARCFTGWTIRNPRGLLNDGEAGTFYFNPRLHDDGEKIVLGHKIPAGGGIKDGLMVLDILARHPSTAKFIATKLSRRFVSDNPSPALVERVAAAFRKSDGDIRETLRAIFTSPEFNSPEAYRAKIKTPFELAVSAIRALGGETDGRPALHQWIARMGEPLYMYQAPTGYPDTAESWVNTGALLERLNFALALASNRIPGTRVDLARYAGGEANQARVADQFFNVILQGDVSPRTKETLLKKLSEPPTATTAAEPNSLMAGNEGAGYDRLARRERREMRAVNASASPVNADVARIAGLILGSPEFQRQ